MLMEMPTLCLLSRCSKNWISGFWICAFVAPLNPRSVQLCGLARAVAVSMAAGYARLTSNTKAMQIWKFMEVSCWLFFLHCFKWFHCMGTWVASQNLKDSSTAASGTTGVPAAWCQTMLLFSLPLAKLSGVIPCTTDINSCRLSR